MTYLFVKGRQRTAESHRLLIARAAAVHSRHLVVAARDTDVLILNSLDCRAVPVPIDLVGRVEAGMAEIGHADGEEAGRSHDDHDGADHNGWLIDGSGCC
jgi:hypothetical protein